MRLGEESWTRGRENVGDEEAQAMTERAYRPPYTHTMKLSRS